MTDDSELNSLSIIFGNTQKKKRVVDLVTLAENCQFLIRRYGSRKAVAKEVGLSTEMIRELLLVLDLPKEVQNLVKNRTIDSIDIIKQLSELQDPNLQINIAEEAQFISSKGIRDIIRLIKTTNISFLDAKKIVTESKIRPMHIYLIDIDDEKINKKILSESKKLNIKPPEFLKKIIKESLSKLD